MTDRDSISTNEVPERRRRHSRSSADKIRPGQLALVVLAVMAAAWVILSVANGIAGRGPVLDDAVADRQLFQFFFPQKYREMRQEKWDERQDQLEQHP